MRRAAARLRVEHRIGQRVISTLRADHLREQHREDNLAPTKDDTANAEERLSQQDELVLGA